MEFLDILFTHETREALTAFIDGVVLQGLKLEFLVIIAVKKNRVPRIVWHLCGLYINCYECRQHFHNTIPVNNKWIWAS
jgi:hypothetical protein